MKNNKEFRASVFAKAEEQRRIKKEKHAVAVRITLAICMLLLVAVPAVYIPLNFGAGNLSTASTTKATSGTEETLPPIVLGTGSTAYTVDVTTANATVATTAEATKATTANVTIETTAKVTTDTEITTDAHSSATDTTLTHDTTNLPTVTTSTYATTVTESKPGTDVSGAFYNGAFAYRIADEAGGETESEIYYLYPDGTGLGEYAEGYISESFFEDYALIVLKITVRGVPRLEKVSAGSGFDITVRADDSSAKSEQGTWIMLVPVPKSEASAAPDGIRVIIGE